MLSIFIVTQIITGKRVVTLLVVNTIVIMRVPSQNHGSCAGIFLKFHFKNMSFLF
jgi:hypothetical protein